MKPTLYRVGLKVPENALLPPPIADIEGAVRAIDVGYHLNHRKGGRAMFNPENGEMIEGIGHRPLADSP